MGDNLDKKKLCFSYFLMMNVHVKFQNSNIMVLKIQFVWQMNRFKKDAWMDNQEAICLLTSFKLGA